MNNFPTFDPITLDVTGIFERKKVHTVGYWHRGIQAHLVRKNKDKGFSIFIQRRSKEVDINKYKLDQSLATQMVEQDNLDPFNTLKRGLKDELGITQYHAQILPFDLRIIKRYANDPAMINKEILSLFLCQSPQNPDYSACKKIIEGYWIGWEEFLALYLKNIDDFTKTSSMYFQHRDILKYIEEATMKYLDGKTLPNFLHSEKTIVGYFPARGKHAYHMLESKENLKKVIQQYE